MFRAGGVCAFAPAPLQPRGLAGFGGAGFRSFAPTGLGFRPNNRAFIHFYLESIIVYRYPYFLQLLIIRGVCRFDEQLPRSYTSTYGTGTGGAPLRAEVRERREQARGEGS